MLPPELQATADDVIMRFRIFVESDIEAEKFPELLSAEEHVGNFVRKIGGGMLQTFVDVRAEQAKANRPPCCCDEKPSVHRTTTWTRETLFGPVSVNDPYLSLRMLKANGWWEDYWSTYRDKWRMRAQGFAQTQHDRAA